MKKYFLLLATDRKEFPLIAKQSSKSILKNALSSITAMNRYMKFLSDLLKAKHLALMHNTAHF